MPRNSTQSQIFALELPAQQQEKPVKRIWQRQKGEPTLWWNRFLRYRKLGPKRTIQAAFLEERKQVALAQKRTENETEGQSDTAPTKKQPVNAPGSWKAASVKYNWIERGRAYDEFIITKMVDDYVDRIYKGFGAKENRIWELQEMARGLRDTLATTIDIQQRCLLIGRFQSVLRDIAAEMADYDRQVAHVTLRRQAVDMYADNQEVINPFIDRDE